MSRAASSPPVDDSASPRRCPWSRSATCSSSEPPSTLKTSGPWRGTRGVEHRGAVRHHRLLAVRRLARLGIEPHRPREAPDDRLDLPLHLAIENELPAGEPGDDLGGEVVGGRPEPTARHDEVGTLCSHEPKRLLEVPRTVADREDLPDLHPELAEALREPRPVAVAHPPGQELG